MLPDQSPIENTPWSHLLLQVRQAPSAVPLVADPFSSDPPTKPTVSLYSQRPLRPVLPSADRDVSAGRAAGVLHRHSPSARHSTIFPEEESRPTHPRR